jgi:hypothetical protein
MMFQMGINMYLPIENQRKKPPETILAAIK